MKLSMRTFAVSALSSGLIALGSSVAFAQSVNNLDNTSPGESGHGAGCSNFMGACNSPREVSPSGAYQGGYQSVPSSNTSTGTYSTLGAGPSTNADNTTPGESGHGTGCSNVADGNASGCLTGPTNR